MVSVCLEPTSTQQKGGNFSYVGKGRGAYTQVGTYQYVGNGSGSYLATQAGIKMKGSGCRRACGWCFLLTVTAVIAGIAYGVYYFSVNPSERFASVLGHGTHDCEVPRESGNKFNFSGWSNGRRSWCCLHKQVACSAEDLFQCSGASEDDSWSAEQKKWCCEHKDVGCVKKNKKERHATAAGEHEKARKAKVPAHRKVEHKRISKRVVFDCNDGFDDWQRGWSTPKKEYCCKAANRGCPTDAEKPEGHYDCSSGITWSAVKADWCCKNEKKGCPESASETEVDCELEINHWKTKWSDLKKAFCCESARKGCPEGSSEEGAIQVITDNVKKLPIWHLF